MNLNVYHGCSWREKRDVLNVFWRTDVEANSDVVDAAVQYGYYAVICLVVVMAELAVILAVALDHNALIAAVTVLAEVFMIWSTWWAVKRYRSLRTRSAGSNPILSS